MRSGTTVYYPSAGVANTVLTACSTPASLYNLQAYNITTDEVWLLLFDTADSIVLGTTVPKFVVLVPAGDATHYGSTELAWSCPVEFEYSVRVVAATAVAGTGAPTTAVQTVLMYAK